MISPEVRKGSDSVSPADRAGYIVNRLYDLRSVNNDGFTNVLGFKKGIRDVSIAIKNQLLKLSDEPNLAEEDRLVIARDAENTLTELCKNNNGYAGYARMDILAGLGEFEDSNMQLVIAKSLDDPAEEVRKLSANLLTRPNIEIFPETFKFLLDAKDPKDPKNPDPEKTELVLSILEKNENAGLRVKDPDAAVKKALLDILSCGRTIRGGKHRAAVLVGKLYERLRRKRSEGIDFSSLPPGNNVRLNLTLACYEHMGAEPAAKYLFSEIGEELEKLKLRDNFSQFVDTIYVINLPSARIADDISTMALVLPPEHEAIEILKKMFSHEDLRYTAVLAEFREIRALASQKARRMLQKNITVGREEEKQRTESRRNEESQLAEKRRQEREASLKAQKDERMKRITEERNLADVARNKFHHLR